MNALLLISCIAAVGVVGYLVEPQLRFQLTGVAPTAVEIARGKKVLLQLPGRASPVDLASLPAAQLPQGVLVKTDVTVTDPVSGSTSIIPAGRQASLVAIEGGNCRVSPGKSSATGLVPITETDLIKRIAQGQALPDEDPEMEEPTTASPQPSVPELTQPVTPALSQPSVEPKKPAIAPAEVGVAVDPVKVMQDSIRAAEIKEFSFTQVREWQAGADETLDDQTYQTGTATYIAPTILGDKKLRAKALIQGGKVCRWVRSNSGIQLN